jgi:hypothetical protein
MKRIAKLVILALLAMGLACGGTAAMTGTSPTAVGGIHTGPSHVHQYLEY